MPKFTVTSQETPYHRYFFDNDIKKTQVSRVNQSRKTKVNTLYWKKKWLDASCK